MREHSWQIRFHFCLQVTDATSGALATHPYFWQPQQEAALNNSVLSGASCRVWPRPTPLNTLLLSNALVN